VPATKGARTGPRHRRRIVASVVALSAVVLVGAGIGVAELISRNSSGTVRVGASGGIEVDVPRAWSGQLVNTGWNPGVLQLSGQHAAGLLVADDVAAWPKLDANVNGVFVGLSADARLPAAVAEITHSGCRDEGERTYTSNAWRGQVRRWDHCGASTRSIDEIGLTGVGAGATRAYVQIRQDGSTDAVDTILGALRVRT
jgi:hypothetical protein